MVIINKIFPKLPYQLIIFLIALLTQNKFTFSENIKPKLLNIKQLSAKDGFISLFDRGIYLFSSDLINYKKIYEFNKEQSFAREDTNAILDEFQYEDSIYYTYLLRNVLYIYNSEEKRMNYYRLNYKEDIQPFNMKISNSKIFLFSTENNSLTKSIILHIYHFNKFPEKIDFRKKIQLYEFNEPLAKNKIDCQLSKNLLKCFYHNKNFSLINFYFNENNDHIEKIILKNIELKIYKDKNIKLIQSVISDNNNYFVCILTDDDSSNCFISINNDKFNLVSCATKEFCEDLRVYYFGEGDQFVSACLRKNEIVLSIINNVNNFSKLSCAAKKFVINKYKDHELALIYSKYNKDYKIISHSKYDKTRHLEISDDKIDDIDFNSFYSSDISSSDLLSRTNKKISSESNSEIKGDKSYQNSEITAERNSNEDTNNNFVTEESVTNSDSKNRKIPDSNKYQSSQIVQDSTETKDNNKNNNDEKIKVSDSFTNENTDSSEIKTNSFSSKNKLSENNNIESSTDFEIISPSTTNIDDNPEIISNSSLNDSKEVLKDSSKIMKDSSTPNKFYESSGIDSKSNIEERELSSNSNTNKNDINSYETTSQHILDSSSKMNEKTPEIISSSEPLIDKIKTTNLENKKPKEINNDSTEFIENKVLEKSTGIKYESTIITKKSNELSDNPDLKLNSTSIKKESIISEDSSENTFESSIITNTSKIRDSTNKIIQSSTNMKIGSSYNDINKDSTDLISDSNSQYDIKLDKEKYYSSNIISNKDDNNLSDSYSNKYSDKLNSYSTSKTEKTDSSESSIISSNPTDNKYSDIKPDFSTNINESNNKIHSQTTDDSINPSTNQNESNENYKSTLLDSSSNIDKEKFGTTNNIYTHSPKNNNNIFDSTAQFSVNTDKNIDIISSSNESINSNKVSNIESTKTVDSEFNSSMDIKENVSSEISYRSSINKYERDKETNSNIETEIKTNMNEISSTNNKTINTDKFNNIVSNSIESKFKESSSDINTDLTIVSEKIKSENTDMSIITNSFSTKIEKKINSYNNSDNFDSSMINTNEKGSSSSPETLLESSTIINEFSNVTPEHGVDSSSFRDDVLISSTSDIILDSTKNKFENKEIYSTQGVIEETTNINKNKDINFESTINSKEEQDNIPESTQKVDDILIDKSSIPENNTIITDLISNSEIKTVDSIETNSDSNIIDNKGEHNSKTTTDMATNSKENTRSDDIFYSDILNTKLKYSSKITHQSNTDIKVDEKGDSFSEINSDSIKENIYKSSELENYKNESDIAYIKFNFE